MTKVCVCFFLRDVIYTLEINCFEIELWLNYRCWQTALDQCFSDFTVPTKNLGILLTYRF